MGALMMTRSILIVACTLCGLVLASLSYAQSTEKIEGAARVIDGDTLEVAGERIRLLGIDALERTQWCLVEDVIEDCGEKALRALSEHLASHVVRCDVKLERDRYGRALGICSVDRGNPKGWEDINAWMVSMGYALSYRRFSGLYLAEQQLAKEERRGMWASRFIKPWEWRRGERPSAASDGIGAGIAGP